MFNGRLRSIFLSGIFTLIVLSLITPLGVVTVSFIMIPLLVLSMTMNTKSLLIHLFVSLGIIIVLTGNLGMGLVLISLFFLGPALVMSNMYKKKYAAHLIIALGVVMFLIEMLIGFVVAAMFSVNVVAEFAYFMEESYNTLPEGMLAEGFVEEAIHLFKQMIPFYMIGVAVYFTLITHTIGRWILKKYNIAVSGLNPIKSWVLPKSFVWYYLAVLLLNLFVDPNSSGMLVMVILNLFPLLAIAFCIQGISLLFYAADLKKWNKLLPIGGIVATILITVPFSMLGLFDLMFDLRKKISKQ